MPDQACLFDVTPYLKPHPISKGASQVWELLTRLFKRYGSAFPSQKWLAGQLKTSLRAVNGWIAELRRARLVDRVWRGPRSALYVLLQMWKSPEAAPPVCVPICVPFVAGPITDSKPSTKVFRERPAVKRILKGLPERILGVVKRAWNRILRAANPEAYLQAIVSCEKRLALNEAKNTPISLKRLSPVVAGIRATKAEEMRWAETNLAGRLAEICQ